MSGYSWARFCAELSLIVVCVSLAMIVLIGSDLGSPFLPVASVMGIIGATVLGVLGRRAGGEAKTVANFGLLLSAISLFVMCSASARPNHGATIIRVRTEINLRQVGLALLQYQHIHGRLPPAVVRDGGGKPLYSWRVLILPWLDEKELYDEFHLDEPWDSPHNLTLVERIPRFYGPVQQDGSPGTTFFQVFVGTGTAFESPLGEMLVLNAKARNDGKLHRFRDPIVLAVEAGEAVPWTAPFDIPFEPNLPIPRLGSFREKSGWSYAPAESKGFHIVFADGTVRYQTHPVSLSWLRSLVMMKRD